jgi:capsular exopolysaccharide synthesis family protein
MSTEYPIRLSDTTRGDVSTLVTELEDVGTKSRVVEALQERFDQITARCLESDGERTTAIAVCSAKPREGTTTVGVGIACAAQRLLGRDVVLIETNMTSPMLASEFSVASIPGLSEYLDGSADLEQVVRRAPQAGLWVVCAGERNKSPGPLIRNERFPQIVDALRRIFGMVVLDVPPLLTSPHAAMIARQADGVVLVSRAGKTHAQDIQRAAKTVEGVEVRGLVLNRTRRWVPRWISNIAGIPDSSVD